MKFDTIIWWSGALLGEYDTIGKRKEGRPTVDKNQAPTDATSARKSRSRAKKEVVRAPKEWLVIGATILLISYVPAIIFGTFWGYLASFTIAVAATLSALLALLEDQRRMRLPAYSLDKSFRKLGAVLYGLSTVVVLSVIALVAFQWVKSQ